MDDFPDDPFSKPSSSSSPYLHRPNGLANGPQGQGGVHPSASNESLATWAKTTRFNVLSHFSHVTSAARSGAHTLLTSPLINQVTGGGGGGVGGGAAPHQPGATSSSAASLAMSLLQHGPVGPLGPSDPDWKHSDLAKRSGTGEYDSARVYLAKWANLVAREGEANRVKEHQEQMQQQQLQAAAKANEEAAANGRTEDEEATPLGSFEILDQHPCIERPDPLRQGDRPIDEKSWKGLFDPKGEPLVGFDEARRMIYQWGFGEREGKDVRGSSWSDQGPRTEAWSFLLGVQRWDAKVGREERRREWETKVEEYWSLKQLWTASASGDASQEGRPGAERGAKTDTLLEPSFLKDQTHRIHVDCLRVDRKLPLFRERASSDEDEPATNVHIQRLQEVLMSYVFWDRSREQQAASRAKTSGHEVDEGHNQLGGYVQGMSDLAAPLYSVASGDEVKTFWLFVGLMERMVSPCLLTFSRCGDCN